MAGAIAELARKALAATSATSTRARPASSWSRPGRACCRPSPRSSRPTRRARWRARRRGALGAPVTDCDASGVTIGDERIAARTVIWAAGVAASPAAAGSSAGRPRRARAGRARPDACRATRRCSSIGDPPLSDQRRPAGARHRARRHAAGRLRRQHARARGWPATPPGRSTIATGDHGHDRPPGRGRRLRLAELDGFLAWLLWAGPRLFPDRLPKPPDGHARLGLVVFHLPARLAPDHRSRVALTTLQSPYCVAVHRARRRRGISDLPTRPPIAAMSGNTRCPFPCNGCCQLLTL